MTLTAFDGGGGFQFPEVDHVAANFGTPGGETSFLLDASGEKLGLIVQAPKTGTLHKVHFLTGTVTTGDTLKVSFQNITMTTGAPDETADEYRTIVIANGDDNVIKSTGILSSDGTDTGTPRSVTKGDMLAVVFEFDSYVAGNLNIAARSTTFPAQANGCHYCILKTGGSWGSKTSQPIVALEYSDGTFSWIPSIPGAVSRTVTGFYSSSSTPDERGNILSVSVPMRVTGLWAIGIFSQDVDLVLYDSDGTTALMTCSIDKDLAAGTTNACYYGRLGSGTVNLAANTNYRVAVKPTTTSSVTIYVQKFGAAAQLDQCSGGSSIHYTARTDAGAWSETTTQRVICGALVDAIDDGAGGGGGLMTHRGMVGGMMG